MTHQPQSALVVDGVGGKAGIGLPSVMYEAKKRYVSIEKSEYRIYHAARTYLAMLDDLACDPENVSQYQ
jgi:hypothetical protein